MDLQSLWVADVTIPCPGAPRSALVVTHAPRPARAISVIQDWLERRDIQAEVTLRGTLADHHLDEASQLATDIEDSQPQIGPFGIDDPRSCLTHVTLQTRLTPPSPETLRDLLFFGPRTETGTEAAEHAYALLDGARIFGLPELLESSGLQYACLYQGKAERDYAASAPWLVRLTPDHRLTRMLTDTAAEKGPLAWSANPGLLIRATLSLSGLRRQFRNFTMLFDAQLNRRVYFRFYDPRVFRMVIVNARPELAGRFMRGISLIACPDDRGQILTFSQR